MTMRLLTRPELNEYLAGYKTYPGSVETDQGVLIPDDGCAQDAADWLFEHGAADYIALAFGDWYHAKFSHLPERVRPRYGQAIGNFWYDPDAEAARHKRGQVIDVWPGKYHGAPCPVDDTHGGE